MKSVLDVASWFLSKGSIKHKKLQKLCYYAQAWHCALYDEPLFSERIEAWVHGPVAPALYSEYAPYGWDDIPSKECTVQFTDDEMDILNAVYNTYWKFTGGQLEQLTHREEPWIKARKNLEPWEPGNNPIPTEDMHQFYLKRYSDAQGD